MPNIFKSFLRPAVNQYVFQNVDEIPVEPAPEPKAEESEEEQPRQKPLTEEEAEEQSNAASVIDFAKVQADEIVADARRRGEALVEQCRQQAQEEAEQVREDARAEGYRQGYAEGLKKAQIEGQSKLEEQLGQQERQVRTFLEQATAARDEMLQQTQEELRDLSIAIAEKVIHISLKSSRGIIARMIQVATEKLKRREWVHIYVGGCTSGELSSISPELMTALAGLSDHIKLIPMPEDEAGTCIIEMPDEIIDASASTQLQNIRELLKEG